MSHLNPFDTPFDGEEENRGNPQRLTQWPSISAFAPTPPMPNSTAPSKGKSTKRYSVHKPEPSRKKSRARQREQNERAGIKVITNFSRPPGLAQQAKPQATQSVATRQPAQAPEPHKPEHGGFWNLFWGGGNKPAQATPAAQAAPAAPAQQVVDLNNTGFVRGLGSWSQHERSRTSLSPENDLSPDDRPIMIGLTIPQNDREQQVVSPNTAGTEASIIREYAAPTPNQYMPGTPDIMITPAVGEISYWSPDTASANTPHSRRIPSSIYSRPADSTYYGSYAQPSNAPPVPQIPQSVLDKNNHRDSVDTIFDDDDEVPINFKKKSRIMSAGTTFEEDESPILTRKNRTRPIGSRLKIKTTISPNGNRTSFGWWNTIVSPFIPTPRVPRSSTFLSSADGTEVAHPPLPNFQIPTKAEQDTRAEKTVSLMTTTTIASDAWWDRRTTTESKLDWEAENKREKNGGHSHKTKESVSTQSGTLPFMLGETLQNELGLAAEADARRQRAQENSQQDHSSPSSISRHGPVTYPTYQTTTPPTAYSLYPAPTQTPSRMPPTAGGPLHLQLATMSSQTPEVSGRSIGVRSSSITPSVAPPPYSAAAPRVKAIYPPGHINTLQPPPQSPGPVSPGLQQAMTSTGAIAMEEVPLTPAPREPRRLINLNSGYPTALPPRGTVTPNPLHDSERARKIEAKRQRLEKEDAIAKKARGLWRGRGCVPKRGCLGRGGAEGRRRRRCWCGGIGIFVFLIILVVVLVTQLNKAGSKDAEVPSAWVNLTAFPPMVTGVSTVAAPSNTVENTGCVYPKTLWSCSLPKELQASVVPNKPNQPNFKWLIQRDNSSEANSTWNGSTSTSAGVQKVGNPVSARALIRRLIIEATSVVYSPSPPAPNVKEVAFLSNTTDGIVSGNFQGEATPFYVSLLDPQSNSTAVPKIDSTVDANVSSAAVIQFASDGTALPANLLPATLRQQPLRLFDRGLPTEHYGFYSYFTRSIFLKSTALLNSTNAGNGEVPADRDGGCTKAEAAYRCSWTETRVLVQMWTNRGSTARLLGTPTSSSTQNKNATELATYFTQPGSFPYPVTISLDRHGGEPSEKGVFCYQIDERSRPVEGSARLRPEFRDFGGQLVNPAPGAKGGGDETLGGFDGGNSGCACEWKNFQGVV